jgi:hypothetical protein
VPTSFADSIRIGAATGIDTASITTPSLMMHMAASNAILQLTDRQGKMNMSAVINTMKAAWSAGKPLVTRGRVVLGLAKETVDRAQEQKEDSSASAGGGKASSSSATTGGGMGEGPEDEEGKKKSGEKQYEIPESQEGLQKFIEEAERAGSGLKSDPFHRASTFGGQPQAQIEVQKIVGGDGQSYVRLTQQATLNDLEGYFEYLVNSEGQITHQLFKVK